MLYTAQSYKSGRKKFTVDAKVYVECINHVVIQVGVRIKHAMIYSISVLLQIGSLKSKLVPSNRIACVHCKNMIIILDATKVNLLVW